MVGRQVRQLLPLLAALGAAACGAHGDGAAAAPPALTPEARHAVEDGVRRFMEDVATAVTAEGPSAWRHEFANRPEFFMASDGELVFADGAGAARGIDALAQNLPKISLTFTDLRADALTPQLAVVGSGGAEKAQVQLMMRSILRLDGPVAADAADALAAAVCHALRGQVRASLELATRG